MKTINKFQSRIATYFIICIFLFLAGCSKPLPSEKAQYAGEWQSKEMYLLILQDGSLNYKRLKRGATTEVTGPIKQFVGNNIVVGVGFITTTFVVSKPPHEVGGVWQMEVDGVTLTKTPENS